MHGADAMKLQRKFRIKTETMTTGEVEKGAEVIFVRPL